MNASRFIQLTFHKARIDLKAEAAKTYIGVLWWILDPLMWVAVFYFIFAILLEIRSDAYSDFLLTGLVFWRWFNGTVANGAMAIIQGENLMRHGYIPKELFVLTNILKDLFKFSLIFIILIVYLLVRGYEPVVAWVALVPLMLLQFLLIIGTTFLVAAVTPLLPDLRFIINNLLIAGMFLSGIFYDGRTLSPEKQDLLYLNPMASVLESYRVILLESSLPDFGRLIIPGCVSIIILMISLLVLRKLDRQYPVILSSR